MEALVRANRCNDQESRENCLAQLPVAVRRPQSRNIEKNRPANSAAKQQKKRIAESLKKALQTVLWSSVTNKYEAQFVVRKDLDASMDHRAAEDAWKNWCFCLAVKEVQGMPEPVTQAEALAAWKNQGYSWQGSLQWWSSIPSSVPRVEENEHEVCEVL